MTIGSGALPKRDNRASERYTFPPIKMEVKNGSFHYSSYLSIQQFSHFHDYGRKSNWKCGDVQPMGFYPFSIRFPWLQAQTFRQSLVLHADEHGRNQATEPNRIENDLIVEKKLGRFCLFETFPNANPENNLLGPWLNFKLFGITYLVGKVKFKLLFQGPLAK